MTDKLCKDCKWCDHVEKPWYAFCTWTYYPPIEYAKCRNPVAMTTSPLDGSVIYKKDAVEYCSISRRDYLRWEKQTIQKYIENGKCGPEGIYWEPKE